MNNDIEKSKKNKNQPTGSVAVIGMAARFPGARDCDEFWENLADAKNSVLEIPAERWDKNEYYSSLRDDANKTVSKWGGFIDDVDQFDAPFFSISRREAELMDPQQRIMLELAWKCFEDAGYAPKKFSNSRTGVYIGVMNFDYREQIERSGQNVEAHMSTGLHTSLIPNRISHFFNLSGPSISIDTACSGSLVALHDAVHAIRRGDCKSALVGGVSVLCSPTHFISFSKTGMLSKSGACKSFDQQANGYVRGEGAGFVLLKPLEEAIEDGDQIYGVIRGTAMNHGGRVRTLTYPNNIAQANVIVAAHKDANISPDSITYIEAHGTGTPKGDPIEIEGLKRAFSELAEHFGTSLSPQTCGIGSAKANIGHLESAAGIAGLIKTLLCIKNKTLPKLTHFQQLNHRIDLEGSPFYIVQELKAWTALKDAQGNDIPRRAGISSFGFGGVNAHAVVEEYVPVNASSSPCVSRENPALIVLSAKNAEQLIEQARQLLDAMQRKSFTDADLPNIAYTLQVGRDAMEERLAMMAESIADLETKLNAFVAGRESTVQLFRGQSKAGKDATLALFGEDEDLQETIEKWAARKKYSNILNLWIQGLSFDWGKLYGEFRPARISLPTYPFAKERYWISQANNKKSSQLVATDGIGPGRLHPLLQTNTSNLNGPQFSSRFTLDDPFFAHHVIAGKPIFPDVAYLEMAHEAIRRISAIDVETVMVQLKNIVWTRPMIVQGNAIDVHIALSAEDNGRISYQIHSESSEKGVAETIYCQGVALLVPREAPLTLDLKAIQGECGDECQSSNAFYAGFREIGFDYGPSFSLVEEACFGEHIGLAKLMPASSPGASEQFVLHPGVVYSAVQAGLGYLAYNGRIAKASMPFSLDYLRVFGACASARWAVVRMSRHVDENSGMPTIDIDICDDNGVVCVSLEGMSFRDIKDIDKTIPRPGYGTLSMYQEWKPLAPVLKTAKAPFYRKKVVVLCDAGVSQENLRDELGARHYVFLRPQGRGIEKDFEHYAISVLDQIKNIIAENPIENILLQVVVNNMDGQQLFSGLTGLLKTARLESPKLVSQLIEMDFSSNPEKLIEILEESERRPAEQWVRYTNGQPLVATWVEITAHEMKNPWRPNGVYLITGGAGGLGTIFAKEIALQAPGATLILAGRSSLDDGKATFMHELKTLGARPEYRQVDIGDQTATENLINDIVELHGGLHGILHCAGTIRDSFLLKKTSEELHDVFTPKVAGLVNLDQASRDVKLDCFICFSSIVGAIGNVGQADYAAANVFMDSYVNYRNAKAASGQRHGQAISIGWPLWQDGGMHVDPVNQNLMEQTIGMVPMQTENGIEGLYRALATGHGHVLIVEGVVERIRHTLTSPRDMVQPEEVASSDKKARPSIGKDVLHEKTLHYLKKIFSSILALPASKIDADAQLEQYGIDSILITQVTTELEKTFGSLSKTLLFEYQTIQALTSYFVSAHDEQLIVLFNAYQVAASTGLAPPSVEVVAPEAAFSAPKNAKRSRFAPALNLAAAPDLQSVSLPQVKTERDADLNGDIAIIGLAGRYPGAKNTQAFWEILSAGKDCITEIPAERWDYREYFDEDRNKPGKTYCKWGGFIDGVDQFDSRFFNISPREAEIMDPQERLFLQSAYEALEDSGYTKDTFSADGNVGVYVGVVNEEYQLYGAQETIQGRPLALWGNSASVANRVSYFFDWNGPSMAVNTMCSSSLTAVHMACESLRSGACEVAIAGGVNVTVHPNKYLFLAQGKFISSKGRCESFGQGADGYVPAEGVGAVVLKPLSKAITDGDHIYGIIKGSAINHGGKTNGFTVPNPHAQANVIARAVKQARIDPRTISYIEAHGTGTSLGDPIEITGLSKVFQEYTQDKQFCAIGSAKSNIGHCESASGIAGITKLLLQLKHKQLVPSLHSRTLNPNIDFENTPFIVQQELTEWKRPVIEVRGKEAEFPRRAGISSFGAGGMNAHVVIEEYVAPARQSAERTTAIDPVLIPLSAKNEARLKLKASQLLNAIQTGSFEDEDLTDIAYTLQVGREAMDERIAMIATSIDEVMEKLKKFLDGKEDIDDFFQGQVKRNKEAVQVFIRDEELQEAIAKWAERKKYSKLLDMWVKGLPFDWRTLYPANTRKRVSLPTYPFSEERHWAPQISTAAPIQHTDVSKEDGEVRARLKGLSVREMTNLQPADASTSIGALMLCPDWTLQKTISSEPLPRYLETIVVLCGHEEISCARIEEKMEDLECLHLPLWPDCIDAFENSAEILFNRIKKIMIDRPKGNVLVQLVIPALGEQKILSGLAGMLKTARLENPRLLGQVIEVESGERETALARKLQDNSRMPQDLHIRYEEGERWVAGWSEVPMSSHMADMPWKEQGVYLIAGGAGGLGLIFAEDIAQKAKNAKIILTGRSGLSAEKKEYIRKLEESGATVEYRKMDVSDKESVREVIDDIRKRFGNLNGILHCAGISRAGLIANKTAANFKEVLASKVAGTVHLDEASKDLQLDYFICFSSIASALGSAGLADYASANGFMDAYAGYRNTLVALEQRHGQTLSINWPLWKNGGMHVDKSIETMMAQSMGLVPMRTSTGINALYQALASGKDQIMVLEGTLSRIRQKVLLNEIRHTASASRAVAIENRLSDADAVKGKLASMVSTLLKVRPGDIDGDAELNTFGFDSITFTEFSNILNREYQLELTPSVFFEQPTLNRIADYLLREHAEVFVKDKSPVQAPMQASRADKYMAAEDVKEKLASMVSTLLKVQPSDIDGDAELNTFGFDSITFTEFSNILNREYQLELTPSVFFEQSTLNRIADYLLTEHAKVFVEQASTAAPSNFSASISMREAVVSHDECLDIGVALSDVALDAASMTKASRSENATHAGLSMMTVRGAETIPVALYYPTRSLPHKRNMGSFSPIVAVNGALPGSVKGLILISHCTGGNEFGHHNLAQTLASRGYLVAAPQHAHDNWFDISLSLSKSYYAERTRQLSVVLDALLADPAWKEKIPANRIGIIGYSAGATSALAITGGRLNPVRLATEYGLSTISPVFGRIDDAVSEPTVEDLISEYGNMDFEVTDKRIRAAVAMAPLGVLFEPSSLSRIKVPLKIYTAQIDDVLSQYNNRSDYLFDQLPGGDLEEVRNAGHFAFMALPNRRVAITGFDPSDDPAGFDRVAFHSRLEREVAEFFDRNLT